MSKSKIKGTKGNDVLDGADDVLYTDNKFNGHEGDDILYGRLGDDNLHGGKGDDLLDGGAGSDRIKAGKGDDLVIQTGLNEDGEYDRYDGGKGEDTFRLELTADEFLAVQSELVLLQESIAAGDKHFKSDVLGFELKSFENFELLVDGQVQDATQPLPVVAVDPLFTNGADTVDFNDVDTAILSTAQLDANDDLHESLDGDDVITLPGDEAAATAASYDASLVFNAGAGNDTVIGGDLDDLIDGGAGDDVLSGGAGDDTFYLGQGKDTVDGGTGSDTVDYSGYTTSNADMMGWFEAVGVYGVDTDGVMVNLQGGDTMGNTFTNVENVNGSELGDELYGTMGSNIINGAGGNDVLDGRAGDDILNGGAGDDVILGGYYWQHDIAALGDGDDVITGGLGDDWLMGGDGSDTFIYNSGDGSDTVIGGRAATVKGPSGGSTAAAYDDAADTDVLRLNLTQSDYDAAQAEIAAFENILQTTGNETSYVFNSLGLDVMGIEDLQVYVDGVLV